MPCAFFFFPAVLNLSWSTRDLCFGRQVLVPWLGIKLGPLALEAQCFNHWTTRVVPYAMCLFLPGRCTFASHSWNSFLTLLPFGWSFFFFFLNPCSVQFTQLCQTLCKPMNCSTPDLPVHHQLPEFTQTPVHWVGDAIQPSHPLSFLSPPAPNPSQHQSLFQWVNSSHEVTKVLEFQL